MQVKDHVLLRQATQLEEVDQEFRAMLAPQEIQSIVDLIPSEWLSAESRDEAETNRRVYYDFLVTRIVNSDIFVKEAQNARQTLI